MYKTIKLPQLLLILLIVLGMAPVSARSAQLQSEPVSLPGPTIQVRLDPHVRQQYVAPPEVFQRRVAGLEHAATATILVNYNGSGWRT